MIANAGIFTFSSILDGLLRILQSQAFSHRFLASTEDFDRVMRINVCGVMLCYKHAAKQMIAQGRGGRILCECFSCNILIPAWKTLNTRGRRIVGCWQSR